MRNLIRLMPQKNAVLIQNGCIYLNQWVKCFGAEGDCALLNADYLASGMKHTGKTANNNPASQKETLSVAGCALGCNWRSTVASDGAKVTVSSKNNALHKPKVTASDKSMSYDTASAALHHAKGVTLSPGAGGDAINFEYPGHSAKHFAQVISADLRVNNTDAQILCGRNPYTQSSFVRLAFRPCNPMISLNSSESSESGKSYSAEFLAQFNYNGNRDGSTVSSIEKGEDCGPALWYCLDQNQPFAGSCFAFWRCRRLISLNTDSGKKLPVLLSGVTGCSPGASCSFFIGQPFGSMPKRSSSFRPSVFIQFPKLIPASVAAVSNCAFSSGVKRTLNIGERPAPLGLLSLNIVDMYRPIDLVSKSLGLYPITVSLIKTTPPNGITSTERGLTTTVNLDNEVAMSNNTTPLTGRNVCTPQTVVTQQVFIWLIIAVRRDCPTITAKIHHIPAKSEREARQGLARDHVCFFAGRLPLQGGMEMITPSNIAKIETVQEVRHV